MRYLFPSLPSTPRNVTRFPVETSYVLSYASPVTSRCIACYALTITKNMLFLDHLSRSNRLYRNGIDLNL